jgi:leucyl aminopeptidase
VISINAAYSKIKPLPNSVKLDFFFEDQNIPASALALGFKAKKSQKLLLAESNHGAIILAGLGSAKNFTIETLRQLGAQACQMATSHNFTTLLVNLPTKGKNSDNAIAFSEGAWLGNYRFEKWQSNPEQDNSKLKNITLLCKSQSQIKEIDQALKKTKIICQAVIETRDLVNTPPSAKTPAKIVALAKKISGQTPGLKIKVLDKKMIASLGMGGLLGVARGSAHPPFFLHLSYQGKSSHKKIALVGKGLTFDSGGLSLKPAKSMEDMKIDMAGAATVIYTLRAAALLNLPLEIHGLCPLTENMPGPDAQKPGDVLKALNGKTMEVLNTDAEGRLILADALSYACRLKPDYLIDFATLTGAAIAALGMNITAVLGQDQLCREIILSGQKTGESFWQLPLPEKYKEHIKSKVADIKNIGNPGEAGTISAALFLKEFVDLDRWAHCDIAGPAYLNKPDGIHPTGATGTPVRTILEFLKNL